MSKASFLEDWTWAVAHARRTGAPVYVTECATGRALFTPEALAHSPAQQGHVTARTMHPAFMMHAAPCDCDTCNLFTKG